MKAVILAAGKGTRLYPVTQHIPKPLLPIANRMTLEYAFDQIKGMDITEVCVVVGENEDILRQTLGDGKQYGLHLSYARQHEPKGLAHAVQSAQDFAGNDPFVLYLGDAMYDQPFSAYRDKFESTGCANLNLVKHVNDPRRFGVAVLDGDRMTKLVEKPQNPESNWAMAGMYIFGREIWTVLPDLQPSARGEYEITDAIQMLVDRGFDVRAGIYEGTWFDTGTLDSYLETSRFITGGDRILGVNAEVTGMVGHHVVIGENAVVECESIEDSVVLPGSHVKVKGPIRSAVLGGDVNSERGIENDVVWANESRLAMSN